MFIEKLTTKQIKELTNILGNDMYIEVLNVEIILCTKYNGHLKTVVQTTTKDYGTYIDTYEMSDFECRDRYEVRRALTATMQEYLIKTFGKAYEKELKKRDNTFVSVNSL